MSSLTIADGRDNVFRDLVFYNAKSKTPYYCAVTVQMTAFDE